MMRKLFFTLFSLLIIFLLFIIFLCTTQAGLNTTIKLAQKLLPGKLSVEQAQGKILGNLTVANFYYKNKDTKITLNYLQFNWKPSALFKNKLDIQKLYVNRLYLQLPEDKNPKPIDWNNLHLPINTNIQDLTLYDFKFARGKNTPFTIQSADLQGHSKKDTVYVNRLHILTDNYEVNGKGYLSISTPFSSQFSGSAIYMQENFKPIHLDYSLSGEINNANLHLKISNPFTAEIVAHLSDPFNDGLVDIKGHWDKILWPLDKKNSLTSEHGKINLVGTSKNYTLSLATDLSGTKIPNALIALRGQGNHEKIYLQQISISILHGLIEGSGLVNWTQALSWETNLRAEHLNPAAFYHCWPGDINFNLASHGTLNESQPDLYLAISQLNGSLNNLPLNGYATIEQKNNSWLIDQSLSATAENNIRINGHLDQNSSLQWNIQLFNLSRLTKLITGKINSQGTFTGSLEHPGANFNLQIDQFSMPNTAVNSLTAHGNINLQNNSTLLLNAKNIHVAGQTISQANVNAQGSLASHQALMQVFSSEGNIIVSANGKYNQKNKLWRGDLQQLTIDSTHLGIWRLNRPVDITAGKIIKVSPFCWASNRGSVCGQGNFNSANNWSAKLTLANLNLALIKDFLPKQYNLNSNINGNIDLATRKDGTAQGNFNLQLASVNFTYPVNEKPYTLQLTKSYIQGTLSKAGLQSKIFLQDNNHQLPISGTLNLPDYRGNSIPNGDTKITGSVLANWHTLNFLAPFITFADSVDGNANINLTLSGTLQQPLIAGEINISKAQMTIPQRGLNLTDITIKALFNKSNKIGLSGQLTSGKGVLNFTGESNLDWSFSPMTLKITGNNVTVYNYAGYTVYANPNLTLNYTEPKLDLTGSVFIPEAIIAPKDFSSTVELPANATIIDRDKQNINGGLETYFNVNVTLGDNIVVEYGGLHTYLGGSVTVNRAPEEVITATGKLNTTKGYYKAYGQELKIQVGDLLFTGGSVLNPGLNILAVKTIQADQFGDTYLNTSSTIIVGVRIIGSMLQPRISFYSVPTMPTATILSYLLFGQGSASLSDANFQALTQAASSMGVSGDGIMDSIKNQLKLTQFGVESGQVYNPQTQQLEQNTSLVLGKQLSKKLSVSYSIGILVPVNILRVRYILSKHWSAQSDASAYGSGADIIYTLQSN